MTTDEFKIERDVPIPANKGRGAGRRYPFETMQPGESFAVDVPEGIKPKIIYGRLNAALASRRKGLPGRKFIVRLVEEKDGAGNPIKRVRVWRGVDEEGGQ